MTTRVRYLGISLIVGIWTLLAYLIAYYAILLTFGPDRLYSAVGARVYNALFPNGGFLLLLSAALLGAVWALPIGFFFAIVAGVLRWLAAEKAPTWRRSRAAVAAVLLTAGLHFGSLDGWPWIAFPYLGGDDTEFAPTYSALGFWSIHQGLSSGDVAARAGQPLERYPITGHPDEEGWRWSRSPHSSDYRVRAVVFRNGRVLERFSEYYLD